MENLGGEFIWDYTTRQYVSVVYHTHNGIELRTSAWLNCLRSTAEKLSLYTQHNLGGVAWWQKGFELTALWGMVDDIINP
jgi:spore germination protein YaaH